MLKLSIIIPVYRVEKYLRRCVDTLLAQITSNVEIILIDDGSDDSCPQICDEYSKKHSNIKTIHKENGGLASAVTFGVENSVGEYIGFCDSDDWVSNDYITKILEVINTNNVDVICFDFKRIQEWDKKTSISHCSLLSEGMSIGAMCERAKVAYMRPGGISPNRWTKVVRRELAIKTLKYYDNRVSIGEDIMFTAPIVNKMNSMYYINEPLINYNINRQSMTQNFNYRYISDFNLLYLSLDKALINNYNMLNYINYINMRTMVNAIGKSSMKRKNKYLKSILNDSNYSNRLKLVNIKNLRKEDRFFLSLMKMKSSWILLVIAYLYRKMKK